MDSLELRIKDYKNTKQINDLIWTDFNVLTDSLEFLRKHRNYIEQNNLGYGDRCHHYMWYLIFDCLKKRTDLNVLEIGVFKGQVISLWALLANYFDVNAHIFGISPFEGNLSKNRLINNRYASKLRVLFDKSFKRNISKGNSYLKEDYLRIIKNLFEYHNLDFDKLNLIKGLSNAPIVINQASKLKYDIIYIDGDHSYHAVLHDIKTYSLMVKRNGFLVMDDASNLIPGSVFWKGRPEVSKACESIYDFGFKNVLNVGHNRIFQKIE